MGREKGPGPADCEVIRISDSPKPTVEMVRKSWLADLMGNLQSKFAAGSQHFAGEGATRYDQLRFGKPDHGLR